MRLSQKRLKESILEFKNELELLKIDIKSREDRARLVYEALISCEKDLRKVCKHKNHSTECKMVHRRLDYIDWDEPEIFYTCLDCGYKY